jgi:polyphenol oxidase
VNEAPYPPLPAGVAQVTERAADTGAVPLFRNPRWADAHPWLEQGITGRGAGPPYDMGLFGAAVARESAARWRALRSTTGFPGAVHAHQVHQATVLHHATPYAGLFIADDADGHVTAAPGMLLTVSVADCVPIALVAPAARAVALLHAGWRGAAAGVLEAGAEALGHHHGVRPAALEAHFGPAICGACFEVGPEVPRGLGLLPPTGDTAGGADDGERHAYVDLRAALAERALRIGIPAHAVSVSTHCTRCGDGAFFSHRGGERERQVAFLGIRPPRRH